MNTTGDYSRLTTSEEQLNATCTSTSGLLPSYIRSLSLKEHVDVAVTVETTQETNKSSTCSSKCVYITLSLVFIVVTALAVSISVMKVIEIKNENDINKAHSQSSSIEAGDDLAVKLPNVVMETATSSKTYTRVFGYTRERCAGQCSVYKSSKFGASCIHGYCVCHSNDYQAATCLPTYNGCSIAKSRDRGTKAFMALQQTPVYTCAAESTSPRDVHVISIHGNHFAKSTLVNLSGTSGKPIVLVLAGNYPINWKLKYHNLNIEQIITVSERPLSKTSLAIDAINQQSHNAISRKPEIHQIRGPCGYGDDRHASSRTVDMLRVITSKFGKIRTFTGADYATFIDIKLPTS